MLITIVPSMMQDLSRFALAALAGLLWCVAVFSALEPLGLKPLPAGASQAISQPHTLTGMAGL